MKDLIKAHGNKSIEIQLGVLVFQEGESYVAYCPSLDLSTYGDSVADAKDAFEDLIKSYSEDCARMGTLEKDLEAHGWTKQSNKKGILPPNEIDLNIPAGVLRKTYNEPFQIPAFAC